MKRVRMKPAARKAAIIKAAIGLAEKSHYLKITREQIAEAADVSGPTVQYHFKTMTQLRNQLMRAAVRGEHLRVIAQGLLACDSRAEKASPDIKTKAWESVV